MGAYQLDKPNDRDSFFNWYTFVSNVCLIVSCTAIVYVVDNVSWAWGFGISSAANTLGLLLLFSSTRFYRQMKPQGSPFTGLGRVVVKAVKNRGILLSQNPGVYFQGPENNKIPTLPSKFFRFLNRAALKTERDLETNESTRKSGQLCTITEIEDLKDLIKIVPLFTSGLLVRVPYVIQVSLGILQALKMDRSLGPDFKVPAAIIVAFIHIHLYQRRFHRSNLISNLDMVVLALVEAKRLKISRMHNLQNEDNGAEVPMSIFWLVPPLALVGMGEAFHLPGLVSFYYQEFPDYLKNTSVGVVSLFYGIAFYIGNALIHVIHRSTDWLPENINKGRLDIVYCLITIIVGVNFCYFLLCGSLYKYKAAEIVEDGVSLSEE
ncbi:OLC1v1004086C1 [Oldenlandia corymbosa var. corymbosa]|uniref:OLC1v1004086C1 n=1 Tax=Oldenlandia corymbosa var. corymbosa TaxID=529605 RepID=A0AAV1DC94_OLDCO|nr:OLC1v1004086C1 [Oldenlandia corymbosa var. corymbosa]